MEEILTVTKLIGVFVVLVSAGAFGIALGNKFWTGKWNPDYFDDLRHDFNLLLDHLNLEIWEDREIRKRK